MSIDLYAINPKTVLSKTYRNSIWTWHPMWNYIEINYSDLITDFDGHSNNGDIYPEEKCKKLYKAIIDDLNNNKIQNYLNEYNMFLNSLPETTCQYCFGIGFERKNILFKTEDICFKCNGSGISKMFITNYKTYINDFYNFATFLNDCGGFKIL